MLQIGLRNKAELAINGRIHSDFVVLTVLYMNNPRLVVFKVGVIPLFSGNSRVFVVI